MTSFVPPKKNDSNGYVFYMSLAPRTATGAWQANPTLAAGDVKIAIDDGAPANLGTLPAVDADFTKRVKVVLSQAETNGDNISIIFSDAAGAEWCDATFNLQTVAENFDGLNTKVDTIDNFIDTEVAAILAAVDTEVGAIKTVTDTLSLAAIADGVWDEAAAGHGSAGTFGLAVSDILTDTSTTLQVEIDGVQADTEDIQSRLPAALVSGRIDASVGAMAANVMTAAAAAADLTTELQNGLATAVSITSLDAKIDTIDNFLDTEIAAILADTNELQTDWVDGGRLDLLLDAVKAKTDGLPSDPADASVVAGLIAAVDAKIDTIDNFLDTEVAAILADTNELQTDWVDGGRLDLILDARASQASVDTVDTVVDAIKAKTDALPTDPADQSLIIAATDAITAAIAALNDLSAAEVMASTIEGSLDVTEALRLILASLVGKLSGAATTEVTIRDTADTVDRIVATVDADGNRTAVTLNAN